MKTQNTKPDVLLVEDSSELSIVYKSYLEKEGCKVVLAETGNDALDSLKANAFSIVLLDIQLPDVSGMDVLKFIHDNNMPLSVIVITAHGSIDIAVDAMRYGAFDFITKPFNASRLKVTLGNALKQQELLGTIAHYKEAYEKDYFCNIIGRSKTMQNVYHIIESAAPSNATVFITGESGTGKELCAEAIHLKSNRKDEPFIALNCAALPKDLIESEIFGHVKGAFTGATSDRDGAASQADGGTMFLDEICEMDLALQSKLLRFIQTGTFQKIGGNKQVKVNVRFVCATNRDPLKEVEEGRFREDLYYRLHVIPLTMPALKDRDDDVLLIAQSFLKQYCDEENKAVKTMTQSAEFELLNYKWPGNVRELQNIIRNTIVLNPADDIKSFNLAVDPRPESEPQSASTIYQTKTGNSQSQKVTQQNSAESSSSITPLEVVERQVIEHAIDLCGNNIPKAAAALGISASKIYRKIQQWNQ